MSLNFADTASDWASTNIWSYPKKTRSLPTYRKGPKRKGYNIYKERRFSK